MWEAMMAMTEAEAAALAFLEALEQARKSMREQLVTYREKEEQAQ